MVNNFLFEKSHPPTFLYTNEFLTGLGLILPDDGIENEMQ